MKKDYGRSISLQCPTCGGTDFEQDETDIVNCAQCGRSITKQALREENGALIEAEIAEVKANILKDVKADFAKVFKKWK